MKFDEKLPDARSQGPLAPVAEISESLYATMSSPPSSFANTPSKDLVTTKSVSMYSPPW